MLLDYAAAAKDDDDHEDCLTLSQETYSKNLVEQASQLVTEMKIVNDALEKVTGKIKDLSKDVDRAAKSMMYNLEQKIQTHLRLKRVASKGKKSLKNLPSAVELTAYAQQSASYLQTVRNALVIAHNSL